MLRISFNIFSRSEPTTNRIQLSLLKLLRCEGGRQKVNFYPRMGIFFKSVYMTSSEVVKGVWIDCL